MNTLSIIIPCYNEEEVLEKTFLELNNVLNNLNRPSEIIFVDDGSQDQTYAIIQKIAKEHSNVSGISLSRNFGKEGVIEAGLKHAKGDMIALMDADLQDPPYLLSEMIRLIEVEGFDQVGTFRTTRNSQSLVTRLFSEMYYRLFNLVNNVRVKNNEREYRMMTKKVVNILLQCHEQGRYIKDLWTWVGFKTTYLGYEDIDRAGGKTKYNIIKKLKLAKKNILVSSIQPLKWVNYFALIYLIFTLLLTFEVILSNQFKLEPFNLLFLWILAFLFIFMGILSEYLAIVVFEVKKRPNYIIRESFESDL